MQSVCSAIRFSRGGSRLFSGLPNIRAARGWKQSHTSIIVDRGWRANDCITIGGCSSLNRGFASTSTNHGLSAVSKATLDVIREIAPEYSQYVREDPNQKQELLLRIPSPTQTHLFETKVGEEFLELRCHFNEERGWYELSVRWPAVLKSETAPTSLTERSLDIEHFELVESDGAPDESDLIEAVKQAFSIVESLRSEKMKVARTMRMKAPYLLHELTRSSETQSPSPSEPLHRAGIPVKESRKGTLVQIDPSSIDAIVTSRIMDSEETVQESTIPPKHLVMLRSWKGKYDEIVLPPNARKLDEQHISIE